MQRTPSRTTLTDEMTSVSPLGVSPWGMSPWGVSPWGVSPWEVSYSPS